MHTCQESCVQLNLILHFTIYLKRYKCAKIINISAISISETNHYNASTLKIDLDFDSMKPNMSAILKCKENIGSSYIFFQKTTFSVEK